MEEQEFEEKIAEDRERERKRKEGKGEGQKNGVWDLRSESREAPSQEKDGEEMAPAPRMGILFSFLLTMVSLGWSVAA